MSNRQPRRVSRRSFLVVALAAIPTVACGSMTPPTPSVVAPAGTPAAEAQAARAAATVAARTEPTPVKPATPVGPAATPTATLVPPKPTVTPTPRPPTPTPVVKGIPRTIQIPKIGVSAPIAGLGTSPQGQLDAPDGPDVVGWYLGGPKPGEPGNALMTGHLDWRTGQTAVFWRLRELNPGDEVLVKFDNETLRFTVESTTVYDRDTAPADQILGFVVGRVVTLLTCEGRFIPEERDYTQRRVVRARLSV